MHTETTVVAVAVAFTRAIGPLLGVRGGKGVSVWAEGPAVSQSCPLHSILQPWQTCALSREDKILRVDDRLPGVRAPDAHQRYRQRLYWLRTVPTWQKVAAVSLLVLAPMALTMWSTTAPAVLPEAAGAGAFVAAATQSTQWHGVSLGGWLVMEINPAVKTKGDPMDLRPSWMYDQIEANSELDFVLKLRKEHGDAYAIQTMKNHWAGYITDAQLDAAQALGVDTVRIPLGYWIADAPVGGSSPLEYGISPEGFVTGGLNHLRHMLAQLARRGMGALVDMHAHPCNSACVSDGQYCATTLAFAPTGDSIGDIGNGGLGAIRDIARCGGGSYKTARKPRTGEATWGEVGVNAVDRLAAWLAALPSSEQVAP